jgi:Tfp pilus assembly protein PilP
MKLTIGIIVLSIASTAVGQMPNVIDNTRAKLNAVEQKKGADLNAVSPGVQNSTKPSPSTVTTRVSSNPATLVTVAQKPQVPASGTAVPATGSTTIALKAKTQPAKLASVKAKATPAKAGKAKAEESTSIVAVEDTKIPVEAKKGTAPKKINLTGRRDPFLSPIVSRSVGGSGCSNGKRCLAIDQVALKGVVKSETGMIAVVTNALEKAYFLHENDPVFNGYVVRITGDSIVFKETFRDNLGKALTREVTKKITAPAA